VDVKILTRNFASVADSINRRLALTQEINALYALQLEAVKDATFVGWGVQAKATYEERGRRIVALRTELFGLESHHSHSKPESKRVEGDV
jgi:hypothetical protein